MVMATLADDDGVPGVLGAADRHRARDAAGFLNGILVTRINLPPFIVTLGTLSIFTAIALLYSGGESIQDNRLPDIINFTGETFKIGKFSITVGVIMVLLLYCIVGFALTQTAWGRHIFAVGDVCAIAQVGRYSRDQYIFDFDYAAGIIDRSPRTFHRHSLHESGAAHGAGRIDPRYCDR